MKLITLIAFLALLLSVPVSGFAGEKANLSGTWALDKDKSFSNGPEFDQTMTITHSGEKVKLDAKQKSPRGEVTINEEYTMTVEKLSSLHRIHRTPGASARRRGSPMAEAFWSRTR